METSGKRFYICPECGYVMPKLLDGDAWCAKRNHKPVRMKEVGEDELEAARNPS